MENGRGRCRADESWMSFTCAHSGRSTVAAKSTPVRRAVVDTNITILIQRYTLRPKILHAITTIEATLDS